MPPPTRRPPLVALAVALTLCLAAACGASKPPPVVEPPPPAAPPTAPAQSVTAVVVANGCSRLGKANGKLAETAMSQLVDGCSSFKGDPVRFTAQLLPDGSIFFQPGAGQAQSIPVCVLEHPLKHRVKLSAACALDVRLEQTTIRVPLPPDGGT